MGIKFLRQSRGLACTEPLYMQEPNPLGPAANAQRVGPLYMREANPPEPAVNNYMKGYVVQTPVRVCS